MNAAAGAARRSPRPQTDADGAPQPDATRSRPCPPSTDDPAMPTPRLSRTYTAARCRASTGKSAKRVSIAWAANCSATVIGSNPRPTEQEEPPYPIRAVVARPCMNNAPTVDAPLKRRNRAAKTIVRWTIRPPLLASPCWLIIPRKEPYLRLTPARAPRRLQRRCVVPSLKRALVDPTAIKQTG